MLGTIMDTEVINAAVRLACRAPSLHNSQPWRLVAEHDSLHLFVDPSRKLGSADQSGREALISCGALLHHLRVATTAAGWTARVERFPNPNDLNHVASTDFSPCDFVTRGDRDRADAILRRTTDRLPFAAPPNWESFEHRVRNVVDDDAVRLDVLSDAVRPELAEASRLSGVLRLYDSAYHAELDWWTGGLDTAQGIPLSALVSVTESERVDLGRDFPVGAANERRAGITQDRSTILVMSTDEDSRGDAVRCGEMLSAVLLECTLAGMATCTLSHITESPAGRDVIGALTDSKAFSQLLIRVGRAPMLEGSPVMTPRRPLGEVLTWRGQ
jgi:nitroreductase